MASPISINRSSLPGRELEYIFQTITEGQIASDQTFSKKCHALLEHVLGFNLQADELPTDLKRMREFCRERLATYKIPAKIEITDREQNGGRFKKMRRKL